MDFYLGKYVLLTLTFLHFYSTPMLCSVPPKMDFQMSYRIPDDSSKPLDLELTCDVNKQNGSDLLMLVDIVISKRVGETKRPVVLGSISAVTRKAVPVCKGIDGQFLDVSGNINPIRGSLKVELTIGKEDSQIHDYVCSVQYSNSQLVYKTLYLHKFDPYLKLFSLLARQNFDVSHSVEKKIEALEPANDCTALQAKMQMVMPRQMVFLKDGTPAICDTVTDGGGWTVFQRRINGNTNFYRGWDEYVNGFGDLSSNFWLGLKHIRNILKQGGPYELRVDFAYGLHSYYARYSTFDISDAVTHYKLTVEGYSGTAGDSLTYHNGMAFSTFDADHDENGGNCAAGDHGAWWYKSCFQSNLNGKWGAGSCDGPSWRDKTSCSPATFTEMKVRPISR